MNIFQFINNLHPASKRTFEKAKLIQCDHSQFYQVLNFLDFEITFHSGNTVETDVYYKDTKTHDYVPYDSAHPKLCKDNLPFNLDKRIIVFVYNAENVEMKLKELKKW